MNRYRIGDTGLEVTKVGFGTAALGGMPDTYGYGVDEETARATIREIFAGPVNLLDTSRNYGLGRSEARIGAVIRERGGLPDDFVLSTKLDRDMETGRFDAGQARRSAEESLETLGIDRFQILHLHDPEHSSDLKEITQRGGALDELFRMKEEGLVEAAGIAMGRTDILLPLLKDWPFDIVLNHNRYTLLNRSAGPVFDYAMAHDVAVFNAAPYAGGILAKGSSSFRRITYQVADDIALEPVQVLERACAEYELEPGAAALQFSMRDFHISSTIVGVSRPERVHQTLKWATAHIADSAWQRLEGIEHSSEDPEAHRTFVPE
jgi:D-threo-aldose 1-dehydrogenase